MSDENPIENNDAVNETEAGAEAEVSLIEAARIINEHYRMPAYDADHVTARLAVMDIGGAVSHWLLARVLPEATKRLMEFGDSEAEIEAFDNLFGDFAVEFQNIFLRSPVVTLGALARYIGVPDDEGEVERMLPKLTAVGMRVCYKAVESVDITAGDPRLSLVLAETTLRSVSCNCLGIPVATELYVGQIERLVAMLVGYNPSVEGIVANAYVIISDAFRAVQDKIHDTGTTYFAHTIHLVNAGTAAVEEAGYHNNTASEMFAASWYNTLVSQNQTGLYDDLIPALVEALQPLDISTHLHNVGLLKGFK